MLRDKLKYLNDLMRHFMHVVWRSNTPALACVILARLLRWLHAPVTIYDVIRIGLIS